MLTAIPVVFAVYFGILFLFFALCCYKAKNDEGDYSFLMFLIPAAALHGALLAGAIFLITGTTHAN